MFKKFGVGGKSSKRLNESNRGKGVDVDQSSEEQRHTIGVGEYMYAVIATTEGPPEVLEVQLVPRPKPKADEVLVRVSYAGVNRPDVDQRSVGYPACDPPIILGLECSGTIVEHGVGMSEKDKKAWRKDTKVCAITSGGCYAQFVVVPVAQLLPIPGNTSLKDAATFPQAACTVWSELFMKERLSERLVIFEKKGARLSSGETLLIHKASGGIGTFAIQIARRKGVTVFVTAGNEDKLKACRDLGAELCINHNTESFGELVMKKTNGRGVNVILDGLGISYHRENYSCLSSGGRLISIGPNCNMSGHDSYKENYSCLSSGGRLISIGPNCNMSGHDSYKENSGRHIVRACALQHRTPEMKALIVKKVLKHVWPEIENGHVRAFNNKINPFTFKQAAEAHALMESGNFTGKILLIPGKLP